MTRLFVSLAALLLVWSVRSWIQGSASSPDADTVAPLRVQKATTIQGLPASSPQVLPHGQAEAPLPTERSNVRSVSSPSQAGVSASDAKAWRELLLPALQSPWQLAELEAAMVSLGGSIQKKQAGHPKSGLRWELTSADGLVQAVYVLAEDGSPSHLQAIRIKRILSPESRQAFHRDLDLTVQQPRLRSGDDHVIYTASADDYQLWTRWHPGDPTQPDEIVIERVECPHGADHDPGTSP
jgi:hypothetical protein